MNTQCTLHGRSVLFLASGRQDSPLDSATETTKSKSSMLNGYISKSKQNLQAHQSVSTVSTPAGRREFP